MKQILCVRLPHWSIDRIKRKQAHNKPPAVVASATPLVLVKTVAQRQLILFACEKAQHSGVDPGMTLAEATALCANLTHQEHSPQKDLQALHRLARWMVRFSPVVALEPPDALFLDITGSDRLFHGYDRLAELIEQSLTRFGLRFSLAMAETPGAAWALAEGLSKKREHRTSNIHASSLRSSMLDVRCSMFAFDTLPLTALRLSPQQILSFHALGIHTIGQLMDLPRETLPARFGQSVLLRLDQAIGTIPEPLVPIAHARPIHAKIEFESGIDSLPDLWEAFKILLGQITTELRQRSCGARQLIADFYLPGEPPIVKTICLSRPTANLATMWNLLRCTTETVKCGQDGFCGLKLSVPLFDRLNPEQLLLLDQEARLAAGEMDHLLERLRIRLGEPAVLFPRAVESHLPEMSFCYESGEHSTLNAQRSTLKEKKSKRRTPNVQHQASKEIQGGLSFQSSTFVFPTPEIEKPIPKQRPLHLFSPEEIYCASLAGDLEQRKPISFTRNGHVHQLSCCNGPERITGSWWEGRNKTRDYFDVEDQSGNRFWLFRVAETRKWYLHGMFDS